TFKVSSHEGFTIDNAAIQWQPDGESGGSRWFNIKETTVEAGTNKIVTAIATAVNNTMLVRPATVTLKNKIVDGGDLKVIIAPVYAAPTIKLEGTPAPTQNAITATNATASTLKLYRVTNSQIKLRATAIGGSTITDAAGVTVTGGDTYNTENVYTVVLNNNATTGSFKIINKSDPAKIQTVTVQTFSAAITANNLSVTAANSGNHNIPVQAPAGVTASVKNWGGGNQWFDITTNSLNGNGNIVITQRNNTNNLMKPATVMLTNKIAGGANKEITVTPTLSPISATGGAAIDGDGGSTTGSVTALGYKWTIAPVTSNGITVSPTSGTGNLNLTFKATGHTGANVRTGTFTVTTTDGSPARTVSISATQSGIPRVGNIQVCKTDEGDLNWSDANNSCNNSTKEGYSNWRLPTIDELLAIYSNKSSLQNYDGFTAMSDYYWSSMVYSSGRHWIVYFYSGNTGNTKDTLDNYVRCVRDI
ncbi:DUF1566 domain-containing protein, partial [Parabacteroides segnis]|uniref:Lcl C-terminal domain-containing protein n=1 Tax=Parabacteroides segnis TaxID=2763058 RepID=UPI003515C4DF